MEPDRTGDCLNQKTEPRYTVESVSSEEGLSALEVDWNRLSEAGELPNAFMTYGWFRAWTKQTSKESRRTRINPYVLVLKNGETVVGIVPWVRRIASHLFPVRKLAFSTHHADYNDLLLGVRSEGLIGDLLDFLVRTRKRWDLADLRDLRVTGEGIAHLESVLTRVGLFYRVLHETEGCPYLPISGNADSEMKRFSGHVRRTLSKRRERAIAMGSQLRVIENPQQEPGLLEKLVALDWQKQVHRSSPMFVGAYPEVFQSLFDNLGPRGWLYVALLELEGDPVAYQLGFRCGGKLWDYTKAYDRSFSRFAPGTLLVQALLDYGFTQGYHEYDFLRGEELYKTVWSTGCHRRYRLLIWNRRWISRLCAFTYLKLRVRPGALSPAEPQP